MTVFMTKVWGFEEPSTPLQFAEEGWRENTRAKLSEGDLVILVGTQNERTVEEERGRVLGMMEPSTIPVLWTDFRMRTSNEDFNDGKYRWPYGLLNHRAWKFIHPPSLTEISSRTFHMDSARGIVELTDSEAAKILAYPKKEVELYKSTRTVKRLEGEEAARRHGAPPPTENVRRSIMQMRRAPAYTYAMCIDNADSISFKIGWAFDYKARERQFNQASLPKLGGLKYETKFNELWNTAMQAFQMEQSLLNRFKKHRHPYNQEVICGISSEELRIAWIEYIMR